MNPSKIAFTGLLIAEIEHVFGRKIVSSKDCNELSVEIFNKTEQQLNPNTLRRFFNLVKAQYAPSQSTLTILCQYCGFSSMEDFYKIKTNSAPENEEINKEAVVQYFVDVFKELPAQKKHDHTLLSISIQIIKFLNANKFLTDKFQSLIAKTPNGLHYYFEKLVNVDKLNSFYGNGLRFYEKEKDTLEAKFFTACIYTMKYWLSGEKEKLIRSVELLLTETEDAVQMHPYLKARYFIALLFYYDMVNQGADKVIACIYEYHDQLLKDPASSKYIYYYSYIVSAGLLLTKNSNDALYFVEQNKAKKTVPDEERAFDYSEAYLLIEAAILFRLGQTKQAGDIMAGIKLSEFPFLVKKFLSIIYFALYDKLKPHDSKNNYMVQAEELILETGFRRLGELFQENELKN